MQEASLATPVPRTRALPQVPRWASLGILFGLLSAAVIVLYGPIGVSGTYPRLVGALLRRTSPGFATNNAYLEKMGSLATPESLLVVGLLIGGFVAAMVTRSRPPMVENINVGETTTTRRYINTFIGGFFIIFGARLAGGCTSGHIISGMTQLSVSAFVFAAGVFGAGVVTARLLKGGN